MVEKSDFFAHQIHQRSQKDDLGTDRQENSIILPSMGKASWNKKGHQTEEIGCEKVVRWISKTQAPPRALNETGEMMSMKEVSTLETFESQICLARYSTRKENFVSLKIAKVLLSAVQGCSYNGKMKKGNFGFIRWH
ncbi:hypothetical protein NPIL_464751 [Nephila pilipes]|uniref:Uncharacterized protein n=1 Tax=Nephila pilipes TaxID=299642 RepID=A0A8X6NQW7_NEPPI|nr:hypothetical protein NPIL_464751 [Nephila pilipes]